MNDSLHQNASLFLSLSLLLYVQNLLLSTTPHIQKSKRNNAAKHKILDLFSFFSFYFFLEKLWIVFYHCEKYSREAQRKSRFKRRGCLKKVWPTGSIASSFVQMLFSLLRHPCEMNEQIIHTKNDFLFFFYSSTWKIKRLNMTFTRKQTRPLLIHARSSAYKFDMSPSRALYYVFYRPIVIYILKRCVCTNVHTCSSVFCRLQNIKLIKD